MRATDTLNPIWITDSNTGDVLEVADTIAAADRMLRHLERMLNRPFHLQFVTSPR